VSLIDSRWYALQVWSRHEGQVTSLLAKKGYEIFSPTFTVTGQRRGRAHTRDIPMFPGYVFCQYREGIRERIVDCQNVVRIVGFAGRPAPIDDVEIASIQRLYFSGERAYPWQFITGGQRVRIVSGALKGVEGIFIRGKDRHRVIVSIALLQRSVMVEVGGEHIEAVLPTGSACSRLREASMPMRTSDSVRRLVARA
jgi:transcription antitermination factor NusG